MKTLCATGILLICVILAAGVAQAQTPEDITVVFFYGGYPPFYMEGLEEGMYVDFINAFDEQAEEFNIVLEGQSRKRIDRAMTGGEVQASSLTNPMFVGEEQAANSLFSDPIWKTGNYIIMHANNVFEYSDPEDLFGKTLGVIYGNRNAVFDPHIEAGDIKALPARTNQGLYEALQANKTDAILMNNHVFLYELKQAGIDPSQFVFSETPVFEFDLVTQIQKTHPHFLEALNAFIAQSKENGFLDELSQKYLQ
jgi:ABC-type amino acid transport substrate-binding protein